MAAAAAEAAGLEEIDLDQNLLELGLDSLRAAEFASQACTRLLDPLHPAHLASLKMSDLPTLLSCCQMWPMRH